MSVPEAIDGEGLTVTVTGADVELHPFPSVYVTVYEAADPVVIVELVSVVDQTFPEGYEDDKSTVLPPQMVVDPEGVITGSVGEVNNVTVT